MGKLLSWFGGLPVWAYVALALSTVIAVQTVRLKAAQSATRTEAAAHQATKVDNARVLQEIAALTAKAQAEVRQREVQYAKDSATSRNQAIQEYRDALTAQDRTIADLRSGAIKLRRQWSSCSSPAPDQSGTGAFGPSPDDAADLRSAGAASLVRIGANADTLVRWLQRELQDTRKACAVQ